MGPKSNHNLPSEFTVAREIEDAINTSSCQIWIEEGATVSSKDVWRMRMEFHNAPYRSPEMEVQDMTIATVEGPIPCCIVYIRSFTNSGHDFVYCVPKREHLVEFYGGAYGARDYRGPIFAALVVLAGAFLEEVGPINWRNYKKVPKRTEKTNGVRWRYLFATARRAWSMMSFKADDLRNLEAMLADVLVKQQSPEPEARIPGAISASNYPPEAQRIAIRRNVEVLKKKPDHHDRIFQYLENELYGRAKRQGKDEPTKQQYRLVESLRDNADDFEICYTSEDENGNDIRKGDFNKEDEAHLIFERDGIIEQILEQLALPITVVDDLEPEPPGTPSALKSTIDYGSEEDSLWSQAVEVRKMEADLIQRVAKFTGAPPNRCEEYLSSANWDIDLALRYFHEDQAKSRPGVVKDTKTPEQAQAVITFKSLTNVEDGVASSYLEDAGWDIGRAASRFFEDAEKQGDSSKSADESVYAVSFKSSAKTDETPRRQISPDVGDTTRPADESATLNPSLKASIQRRIEELDAEITRIDLQLEGIDDDGHDTTMHDAPGSEKDTCEQGLYTGLRGKLRVVNEDPSPVVTPRKGLSHAGLPLELDEAGNVVWYQRPTGTLYQQYLAMRLRLQVQHYGHEVVPADDDPHRGITTRERCPAPLVQEELNDSSSSSSDDTGTLPKDTDKSALIKKRRDSLNEMVELLDTIAASQTAEPTKPIDEADAANSLRQLKDQLHSNWAQQAGQAIQVVTWQGGAEGEEGESVSDSADEHDNEDATSSEVVNQEKGAPIKSALRDTSQPRKRTMKVRFNLSDDERSKQVKGKRPSRGRSIVRGTRRSERLRMKAIRAGTAEDEQHKTSIGDKPADKPTGEKVTGEKVTQSTQTEGSTCLPEAESIAPEAQRKRDLFVSKKEDAWDGSHSDEGELQLGSDVNAEGEGDEEVKERQEEQLGSDADAEGEDEEIGERCTKQGDVRQEKEKCPPRVDEKMEG